MLNSIHYRWIKEKLRKPLDNWIAEGKEVKVKVVMRGKKFWGNDSFGKRATWTFAEGEWWMEDEIKEEDIKKEEVES